MPSLEGCKQRQHRLLAAMHEAGLSGAVLSRPKTIGYFTGPVPDPTWPQVLVVRDDGEFTLVTNTEPGREVPAHVRTYTGYTIHKVFG
ncbi:MAG TPA: aminopeptidase P family N-terminal domain-containing protein, partial [Bryobacteraceae bacterium]|nr:aminopeptidase P family N-terminal domain-containing protein [Bryobacteraceae bacterium]